MGNDLEKLIQERIEAGQVPYQIKIGDLEINGAGPYATVTLDGKPCPPVSYIRLEKDWSSGSREGPWKVSIDFYPDLEKVPR